MTSQSPRRGVRRRLPIPGVPCQPAGVPGFAAAAHCQSAGGHESRPGVFRGPRIMIAPSILLVTGSGWFAHDFAQPACH